MTRTHSAPSFPCNQLSACCGALLLLLAVHTAHAVSGRQTYFVPMDTNEIQQAFAAINNGGATIHNVISISVSEAGTIIYYDHWEDGYEADITLPGQSTTLVWGDGVTTNGVLAGFPADVFQAGDIVTLINDIPTPRNPNNLFFDSRDKFFITTVAAVTFYAWPVTPGSVLAGAFEVYETSQYGRNFIAPVGEDSGNNMFEYAAVSIMAQEDDTQLQLDIDDNGTTETFVTINQGETFFTSQGINMGASISADKPVQAHMISGNVNANYESRWFTLFPIEDFSSVYYNPVYTTVAVDPAQIVVYNPGGAAINVEIANGVSTSTIAVNPDAINTFNMPDGVERGTRVRSTGGSPFYALVVMDAGAQVHDWGATLIPETVLTPSILVGWGDGSLDVSPLDGVPDQNYAPVWIMVLGNTTLYVDYDGDPLTGPLTDPVGNKVDEILALNQFESRRIRDNSDNSQTGLRAYTLDGTLIVTAWGQDPSGAADGSPAIDVGTAILPIPVITGEKNWLLEDDADMDGLAGPGDLIRFTIDVKNDVGITIADVNVFDELPGYFAYVTSSTVLNSAPLPDDSVPPAATPFPLDEGGLLLNTVPFGTATTLSFVAQILTPIPAGSTSLGNNVFIESPFGEFDTDITFPFSANPDLQIVKTPRIPHLSAGDTAVFDLFYTNAGGQSTSGVLITDVVPANLTFDPANSDPRWVCTPDANPGSTCTLLLGHLEGGNFTSGTLPIAFMLDDPLPDGLTSITNTATITDDGLNGPDDNPADNISSATIVAGFPQIEKAIIATSVAQTSDTEVTPGLVDLTIGEEILFELTTTLREGLSSGVVVADFLPSFPGGGVLEIIPTSTTVISVGANLTPDVPNPAPNIQDLVDPFGFDDTVDFFFEGVVNTPDGMINQDDQIVIHIGARVVNLPDNMAGVTLSNTALVLDDTPNTAPIDIVFTPFDIVEPQLQLGKTADTSLVANGTTVTFTVTVVHTGASSADAFDLIIDDPLTPNLNLIPGTVAASTGTIVSGNGGGDTRVTVNLDHYARGAAQITITYQAIVGGLTPGTATINAATLDYDTLPALADPHERQYSTSDTATVTAFSPDAAIDMDDFGATTVPGGTVNYTVTFSNPGDADLTGVTITHVVPANTTFNAALSSPGWILTPDTDAGSTATFTVGDLDIAATGSLTLALTVDTPLTNDVTQIVAAVSITDDGASGTDVNPANNTDAEPTPVILSPGLEAFKADALNDADSSGNFTSSDTLTYTIQITNTGDTILDDVVINDTPDTNTLLTTGSVAASQGTVVSGNGAGDTAVSVQLGTLNAGQTTTITFSVTLVEGLSTGTLFVANQGFAASDQTAPEPTDDPDTLIMDDPTLTPVGFNPLLFATKIDSVNDDVDGSNTISPGDTLIYQIVISNTGTTAALNVVFTDTPGTHTTLVPGSVFTDPPAPVISGNNPGDASVQVNVGTLPADASTTLAFVVTINDPLPVGVTFVQNQGLVVSDEFTTGVLTDDPDTAPFPDPTVTPVDAAPDLTIDKNDGGVTAVPGGTIVYTLTYQNVGNQDATGVVITDTVPANATFNPGASTPGWTALPDNNPGSIVTFAVGALDAGSSGNVTIALNVDNPLPAGVAQIVNTVSIIDDGANGADPNPVDNSDTENTPVNAAPDLRVTKTDGGVTVRNGDAIQYTITYQNVGNQDATGVIVRDTVPVDTFFIPGASTPGWVTVPNNNAGSISTYSVGNLPVGASGVLIYVVGVNVIVPPNLTQIVNTVTVDDDGANGPDPTPADNTATETTPVTIVPDINVTKTDALTVDADTTGDVTTGDTLTYTIAIINTGVIALQGVTFNDTPDANSSLISGSVTATQGTVTQGNGPGDASIQVNVGDIPASGTVTVTYQARVNPLPLGVDRLVNQGLASGDNFPDEPSDDPDTVPDNDPTVVLIGQIPEIDVLKSDAVLIDADGSGGATGGDTLRYTVVIENNGTGPALNVTFSDSPDVNTGLITGSVTTSQGSVISGNTAGDVNVYVNVGAIAVDADVTISFDVLIDDPVGLGVTFVANQGFTAGSNFTIVPSDDPDTGALDDPTLTPLQGMPALDALKRDFVLIDADNSGGASAGDVLRYLITISNAGEPNVSGIIFSDTPDANTTLVAGSVVATQGTVDAGNSPGDADVQVTIGALSGGESAGVSFDVTINDPLPGNVAQVANQGTAVSDQHPPVMTDDPDTPPADDPTITPLPVSGELQLRKTDALLIDNNGDGAAGAGDTLRYTVEIRNTGNSAFTNLEFTDTPGMYTALVPRSVVTTGTVVRGNGQADFDVAVTFATLPGLESRTIQFDVVIAVDLPANVTQVENQGLVTADGGVSVPSDDPDTVPGDDTTITPIVGPPVINATKVDQLLIDLNSNGLADPSDTLRYLIVITNSGGSPSNNILFKDDPDVNTTLIAGSVTTSYGSVTQGNTLGAVRVEVTMPPIPPATTVFIQFDVTINLNLPPGVTEISNQGLVWSLEPGDTLTDDPDLCGPYDPTLTPIGANPGGEACKVDALVIDGNSDGFADGGDRIRYTITITNYGFVDIPDVAYDDQPDPYTQLVVGSVSATQGAVVMGNTAGDTVVKVMIGTLAAQSSVTIVYDTDVVDPLPGGVTEISNQGTVWTNGQLEDFPTDDPDTFAIDDPTLTPTGPTANRLYFAEGDVRDGMQTWLLIVNPSPTEWASYRLVFYFEDREPLVVNEFALPQVRKTHHVGQLFAQRGVGEKAFGVKVETLNHATVYAERAIYWDTGGMPRGAGTDSAGALALNTEWLLAEGATTRERETMVLIANPGFSAANLRVTWLRQAGTPIVSNLVCPAQRRLTLNAADFVGVADFSVRIEVLNGQGVIVERTMYGPAAGAARKWGHNVMGCPTTSEHWYFAEGAVHASFETFLLLANPLARDVNATVRYLNDNATPVTQVVALPSQSRTTVNVELFVPGMTDRTFAIEVLTAPGDGIVAERAMYWKTGDYAERSGATAVAGAMQPATRWFLPEGAVWGAAEFEEFVLIGNPGSQDALLRVTCIETDGTVVQTELTVPAGERHTVKVNDYIARDPVTVSVSVLVESQNGAPVVVERAMYWSAGGMPRVEGHAAAGIQP